jgi:hypothetical protein
MCRNNSSYKGRKYLSKILYRIKGFLVTIVSFYLYLQIKKMQGIEINLCVQQKRTLELYVCRSNKSS